jgi:REP element-mobilizing transposase RayT
LPGAAFHITARVHRKERCFDDDLRDVIVSIIARALPRSDAQLLAWSIMPNHYHLVVRQGTAPLSQLLQPINREIALSVHRKQRRKGYVFERRFFSKPSLDADQLRDAIIYTHRNALRAKLCPDVGAWRWCSHRHYLGEITPSDHPHLHVPLELFANSADGKDGRAGYLRYLEWREACDNLNDDGIKPVRPSTFYGDNHWMKNFNAPPQAVIATPEIDLRDVVVRTLKEIDPRLTVDDVRAGWRTRPMIAVRREIIVNAINARHRVADIARFLNMSDTAVSRVAVIVRPRPAVRFDNR